MAFRLTSEPHDERVQGSLGLKPLGLLDAERRTFTRQVKVARLLAGRRGEDAAELELEANDLVGTDQDWARLQVAELRARAQQLYAAALLLADENLSVNPDGKRKASKFVQAERNSTEEGKRALRFYQEGTRR